MTDARFFTHENLCALSRDYLVLVLFVKSRSSAFASAVEIAGRAPLFVERDLKSLRIYAAGFAPTLKGATDVVDLIHYVRGWKGTHFYAQGRMIIGEMKQAYDLESVLQCFIESCIADNWRAHCQKTIDDPHFPIHLTQKLDYIHPMFRHISVLSTEGRYLFPCSYMLRWFEAQPNHPASVRDQIQAEGIAKMCDVCPRFAPDDFGINTEKEPP